MYCSEINIRDPFILKENGRFYLYGTRGASCGHNAGGFDVYVSDDLTEWSEPHEAFSSAEFGMNSDVNWAPEVHKYKGKYYMFASFTKDDNLRGTFILKSDSPEGPFVPHSKGAATPKGWECIDGTFYVEDGRPYLVFCHEHTQVIDGEICYMELSEDLTEPVGEPVFLFRASEPVWADKKAEGEHYVTDGPFMYRTKTNELLMIWSTFINHMYAECIVKFKGGTIKGGFEHLAPMINNDGGHGMLFEDKGQLYFTYHSPNRSGEERVCLVKVKDTGDKIELM